MSFYGEDSPTDATETRRKYLQKWDDKLDAYAYNDRNDLKATDANEENVWFYRDRVGRCRGPAPLSTLRQCWVNGVVDEHTLVWGNGLGDWLPARNVRGLITNIRNPPTIAMHWLMRKFVDTDAKLAAIRRERFERAQAKSDTLAGERVSQWSSERDEEVRSGSRGFLGSMSMRAAPMRRLNGANK